MKTKFFAIGLLGAALAASAVFADNTNTNTNTATTPAMSGQQTTAPTDTNTAPATNTSGNSQTTTQQ